MHNFIALHAPSIEKNLPPSLKKIPLFVFQQIDSTNDFLLRQPLSSTWVIACAEMQTKGRGRFGRTWITASQENIALSLRIPIANNIVTLSGITLVIGLAIVQAVKSLNIQDDIQVKWPNDLYWQGKKLCGILVEHSVVSNAIVIGIGLNVHSILTATPWCSLYDITQKYLDRNLLIAAIITSIDDYLALFFRHGFAYFLPLWEKVDYLCGKQVVMHNIEGTVSGVTVRGELCIKNRAGEYITVSSGEILQICPE